MLKANFLLKVVTSLFIAFLVSQVLARKVVFPSAPVIRPSFKTALANLSINLKRMPEKLFTRNPNLPPPWKRKPLLGQKPPFFYPPTVVPKKTHPILPPTTSPTKTPISTPSPFYQPSPTARFSYPTSTPTPIIFPSPTPGTLPGTPPSEAAAKLLDLINNERQKQGVHNLIFESHLNKAAQDYANIMTSCSHIGPDGSTPSQRFQKAGYPTGMGGENIACGNSNYTIAFQKWMGSAGHKANMLDPTWKSAGIGYSRGYWVLDLGPI